MGVVLHFPPAGEEHEFGVGGAAAVFEVAGGQGEVLEGVGAENSVTSCCLHVFVDDAAEPVSS